MPSRQSQGQHDPRTCPEVQQRLRTEAAVRNQLQVVDQIAPPHRGLSEFLNTKLSELLPSADLMVTEKEDDIDTIFESALEARMFRQALLPNKRKPDTTIPQTEEQCQAHVRTLYKAFKCVPDECGCQDAIKRPFRNQIHHNHLVEALCWEILEALIERSKKDANLVEAWEPGKFKYKKAADWTFEQRFDSMVKTMATSKTICKHLFDVKYLLKVVDDPQTNADRVEANRKLNGLKARVMKRGKEAEEEDKRQSKRLKTEEPDEEEDGDNEEYDSSPAVKQESPQRRWTPNAPRRAQQTVTTPTRSSLPVSHPSSAPANMSMAPPAMHRSRHFHTSPVSHANGVFDNSPTRRATPLGMFGNVGRPSWSPAYGQAMQTPSPKLMQQYSPPMFAPAPAASPDTRFLPAQTTPCSRSASRASTRQTDPVTPSDRGSSHGWLSQPVQENYGFSSGYTSGASTVLHDPFAYSASDNPQWNHNYNSNVGDLTDTATTFGHNDGFERQTPHGHINMSDLLAQEEAEAEHRHEHDGSTESEHEDVDYEVN